MTDEALCTSYSACVYVCMCVGGEENIRGGGCGPGMVLHLCDGQSAHTGKGEDANQCARVYMYGRCIDENEAEK